LATGNFVMPLLYDTATGAERTFPEPVKTAAATFATQGDRDVWVGTNEGEVIFWPEHGPLRRRKISKTFVMAVQQSPDGKLLAVATFDQRLRLLRADTLDEVASGILGLGASYVGFSPDSALLVAGERGGSVQVWGTNPLQLIDSRKVGQKLIGFAVLHNSARYMTLTPEGLVLWAL
jgi:ABC-type amino acid transport substrate-binding protein